MNAGELAEAKGKQETLQAEVAELQRQLQEKVQQNEAEKAKVAASDSKNELDERLKEQDAELANKDGQINQMLIRISILEEENNALTQEMEGIAKG